MPKWKTYQVLVEIPILADTPLRQTVVNQAVARALTTPAPGRHGTTTAFEAQLPITVEAIGTPRAKDPRRVIAAAKRPPAFTPAEIAEGEKLGAMIRESYPALDIGGSLARISARSLATPSGLNPDHSGISLTAANVLLGFMETRCDVSSQHKLPTLTEILSTVTAKTIGTDRVARIIDVLLAEGKLIRYGPYYSDHPIDVL